MSGDPAEPLHLFSGFGIELEYMIVDAQTRDVAPVSDELIKRVTGEYANDVEDGPIAWSNELVLHVIELKTNGPAARLDELPELFHKEIGRVNGELDALGAMLMPTAAHPWMNPMLETRLWPHGSNEIYAAYNRIFDCRGHGWSNLQSMHVNLPFADDTEFHLLHAAIRTLLPILPALSASSPILGWEFTGFMDTRLEYYRRNSERIPCVTGQVVPEHVSSKAQYEEIILGPMYAAIHPYDPEGTLQYEWLNSRGAIARFERNAIEIRVLDVQETPAADLAIAACVSAALKGLAESNWVDPAALEQLKTEDLAAIFLDVVRDADQAVIRNREYLGVFGFPGRDAIVADLWQHLIESNRAGGALLDAPARRHIDYILGHGSLARRIVRACEPGFRRSHIQETWRVLCECLARGEQFAGID